MVLDDGHFGVGDGPDLLASGQKSVDDFSELITISLGPETLAAHGTDFGVKHQSGLIILLQK